jgi:outer membrane receptor protein involved in Fe transport
LYQLTKTNNLMADPAGSFFSVQGGEIRARGVELEAKAALSASVNVVGSYTYTDAEYTTIPPTKATRLLRCQNTWHLVGRLHLPRRRCLV